MPWFSHLPTASEGDNCPLDAHCDTPWHHCLRGLLLDKENNGFKILKIEYKCAHTHTRARARAHAHAHTHTHTLACMCTQCLHDPKLFSDLDLDSIHLPCKSFCKSCKFLQFSRYLSKWLMPFSLRISVIKCTPGTIKRPREVKGS